MNTKWKAVSEKEDAFEVCDRTADEVKWTGTRSILDRMNVSLPAEGSMCDGRWVRVHA